MDSVFVGDSNFATEAFSDAVLAHPFFRSGHCYFFAGDGARISDAADAYPAGPFTKRPIASLVAPVYLVLNIGLNNCRRYNEPAGYSFTAEQIFSEWETYARRVIADGFTLVACTLPPAYDCCAWIGGPSANVEAQSLVRERVNQLIRRSELWDDLVDLAAYFDATPHETLSPSTTAPIEFSEETINAMLHWNARGCRRTVQLTAASIQSGIIPIPLGGLAFENQRDCWHLTVRELCVAAVPNLKPFAPTLLFEEVVTCAVDFGTIPANDSVIIAPAGNFNSGTEGKRLTGFSVDAANPYAEPPPVAIFTMNSMEANANYFSFTAHNPTAYPLVVGAVNFIVSARWYRLP